MTKIRDLWVEDIDVMEMGDADFEQRTTARSSSDRTRRVRPIADSLSELWGITPQESMDRVVRIYLAHLIDSGQLDVDRDEYEIGVLIPKRGWSETLDRPLCEVIETGGRGNVTLSVPPTVDELIDEADKQGIVESKSQLIVDAHEWLVK